MPSVDNEATTPNDGFGDPVEVGDAVQQQESWPTQEQLSETWKTFSKVSAEEEPTVCEPDELGQAGEDLRTLQERQLAAMQARHRTFVEPRLRGGGAHGPVIGKAETDEPRASSLDRAVGLAGFRGSHELGTLHNLLLAEGWVRVPEIVDRWTHRENVELNRYWAEDITVETGYKMGEVWIRAFLPHAHHKHEGPVFTDHIVGLNAHVDGQESTREEYDEMQAHEARVLQRVKAIFRNLAQLRDGVKMGPASEAGDFMGGVALQSHTLKVRMLTPDATMPTRAYSDDAGLDLYTSDAVRIEPGQFVDVPIGIAIGLPAGYWARITGRSSTLRNKRLLVNEGIIDTGYTGPLYVGVTSLAKSTIEVEPGTRLAQLILHENITPWFSLQEVDELDRTDRGAQGFGSSGS